MKKFPQEFETDPNSHYFLSPRPRFQVLQPFEVRLYIRYDGLGYMERIEVTLDREDEFLCLYLMRPWEHSYLAVPFNRLALEERLVPEEVRNHHEYSGVYLEVLSSSIEELCIQISSYDDSIKELSVSAGGVRRVKWPRKMGHLVMGRIELERALDYADSEKLGHVMLHFFETGVGTTYHTSDRDGERRKEITDYDCW